MTESILQQKINKILVDIVSVTDEIRREQLQDEYFELEAQLIHEKELSSIDSYKTLYKKCSLSDSLDHTNNINVSDICKSFKLRPLTTLDNTRTLVPFLSALNATLLIKDMEETLVDTIGKGTVEYTVYIYCLSKYKIDMETCVRVD